MFDFVASISYRTHARSIFLVVHLYLEILLNNNFINKIFLYLNMIHK